MARPEDPRKHAEWRRRLAKFEKSKQTIAEFCEAEGVTLSTFYWWKRRLSNTKAEPHSAAGRNRATGESVSLHPQEAISRPEASGRGSEAMAIVLPNGVRFELPTDNLDLVRTVVESVVRGEYPLPSGRRR